MITISPSFSVGGFHWGVTPFDGQFFRGRTTGSAAIGGARSRRPELRLVVEQPLASERLFHVIESPTHRHPFRRVVLRHWRVAANAAAQGQEGLLEQVGGGPEVPQ